MSDNPQPIEQFAERLEEAMYEAGYTQKALAEELGVTSQTVYAWRKAQHKIGLEHMAKLADVVGWEPGELWPGWDEIRHELHTPGPKLTLKDLDERLRTVERALKLTDSATLDLAEQDAEQARLEQEGRPAARRAGAGRSGRGRPA